MEAVKVDGVIYKVCLRCGQMSFAWNIDCDCIYEEGGIF